MDCYVGALELSNSMFGSKLIINPNFEEATELKARYFIYIYVALIFIMAKNHLLTIQEEYLQIIYFFVL